MQDHPLSQQAKVRCFGNSAAITAEATVINKDRQAPVPTVNLEIAPREGADVNWSRKIVIQLSDQELPVLCGLFMGYIPRVHFKRPGKGIELERQPGGIYIKASAGHGALFSLPAGIGDSFRLCALFLQQLRLQSGIGDETLLLAALRGASTLYKP
jgi:hypothetical protein